MNNYLKKIILVYLVLFYNGCSDDKNNNTFLAEEPLIEVGYITLKKEEVSLKQELSGRIKAIYTSEVRPQIDGIIKKQLFKEGSYVKEGDILYIIDSDSYQATYEQALASLQSSEANLITLKSKNQRYEDSLKFDVISKQDADDAKAAYLQAVALVEQNKALIKNAKINLDRTKIKAQISGYIGISNYTVGALVLANQTELLTTIRDTSVVYADLNQSNIQLFKLKKSLIKDEIKQGSMDVNIILPDNSIYKHSGKLQLKEISVDKNTGSVTVRAEFPNPEGELLDNMFINATIENGIDSNAFLVPQQAVAIDGKSNPIITIIQDDNTIKTKIITIDRAIGNKWVVTGGIQDTDKIIIEGLNKIHEKSVVIPVDVSNQYMKKLENISK